MLTTLNEEILDLINVSEIKGGILESTMIIRQVAQMQAEIKIVLDRRQTQ